MATAIATIGDNGPPEPINEAYEAIKLHIDDLFETAQGFLDGDPIANQETADLVSKLIDDARKARSAAEAQRKEEAKPWDEGKAKVQALWTPLTDEKKGRCALIADTAKRVLSTWLQKLEDEKRAVADAARKEAEEKARAAQQAFQQANFADLEARQQAEALLDEAKRAEKLAARAEKDKAHAKGGERAIGLVSAWTATITDRRAALLYYLVVDPASFEAVIQRLADADVRAGIRSIPGVEVTEERVAR